MSFVIYLGGGALLGALVRWWRPRLAWAWIAGYWLLAGTWFSAPLLSSAVLQAPTDIAYQWRPWREMVETPVIPANGLLGDVPLQMIPFRALVRDRLLRLEAPLWAGELGTGQPLLGNAQSAPFSPLGLLTLPLAPVRSLPVAAALKLFLSLLLTDALVSALGAGRAGAAFAAIAFAFSVYSICWAYYPIGMATAWLPGVMLGVVLLRRGERGGLAGLVACATGMALSGHPETIAHAGLAAATVAAALLATGGAPARQRDQDAPGGELRHAGAAEGSSGADGPSDSGGRHGRGGGRRWRFAGGLAAAAALSAGLSAPALLPFVEALPETVRAQLLARSAHGVEPLPFSMAALRLVIDPLAQGSPRDGDWSGLSNFNETASGYAGLLALALAAAGAAALGGRVLAIVAAGAAALATALAVPPFLALVRALPVLDHAASGRLRLLWVLAAAVAAGLALEPLAARSTGRWLAGACAAAAALALALAPRLGAPWQRAWWLVAAGGCAVTAVAFLWAAAARPERTSRRDPARWLPWLAVACLALDLGLLNWRFLPVLPARFDLAPPPAVEFLTAEARTARRGGAAFRVMGDGEGLLPNLSALYGLWDPRSNDPMQPARATLVVGRAFRGRYQLGGPMLLMQRPYPVPFLGYLGVRYLLTRHREELFPPWEEAWDGQGGKLWRNPETLPLFFMPASWRPARDPADALRTTMANEDFAAAAVVEGTEAGGAAAAPPEAAGGAAPAARGKARDGGATAASKARDGAATAASEAGAGSALLPRPQTGLARLRRINANGFELEAGGPAGGLVVSSVTFCRGWRLSVDGRPAELRRVNAGFLGFMVPAGWHRITLDYRPAGWLWGLRLCGLAAVTALAAIALRVARRRQPRDAAPPAADPSR